MIGSALFACQCSYVEPLISGQESSTIQSAQAFCKTCRTLAGSAKSDVDVGVCLMSSPLTQHFRLSAAVSQAIPHAWLSHLHVLLQNLTSSLLPLPLLPSNAAQQFTCMPLVWQFGLSVLLSVGGAEPGAMLDTANMVPCWMACSMHCTNH